MLEEWEDGDYVISDCGPLGSQTSVNVVNGKHLGTYNDWEEALGAIRADMKKENFFPSVWSVSDHGNISNVSDEVYDC